MVHPLMTVSAAAVPLPTVIAVPMAIASAPTALVIFEFTFCPLVAELIAQSNQTNWTVGSFSGVPSDCVSEFVLAGAASGGHVSSFRWSCARGA